MITEVADYGNGILRWGSFHKKRPTTGQKRCCSGKIFSSSSAVKHHFLPDFLCTFWLFWQSTIAHFPSQHFTVIKTCSGDCGCVIGQKGANNEQTLKAGKLWCCAPRHLQRNAGRLWTTSTRLLYFIYICGWKRDKRKDSELACSQ